MSTESDNVPQDNAPNVVLHQERAEFGIDRMATRYVLHRRIVTEQRQVEVIVRREVLEVEQLPVAPSEVGTPGPDRPPLVIVLSEEVPVVQLELRPYEQVTATVHSITEEHDVSTTVGREHAEVSTTPVTAPRADRR